VPWFVLTDDPDDFSDLPVRAIPARPDGSDGRDYLALLPPTGEGAGPPPITTKGSRSSPRSKTSIPLSTWMQTRASPNFRGSTPSHPVSPCCPSWRRSVAEHLDTCGSWRLPAFEALARHLTGDIEILKTARWCHETCIAITKDGRESRFFAAWTQAADFLQAVKFIRAKEA